MDALEVQIKPPRPSPAPPLIGNLIQIRFDKLPQIAHRLHKVGTGWGGRGGEGGGGRGGFPPWLRGGLHPGARPLPALSSTFRYIIYIYKAAWGAFIQKAGRLACALALPPAAWPADSVAPRTISPPPTHSPKLL